MDVTNSTKTCTNCEHAIEVSKYQLHDAFCRRNLKLCQICNEPILIRELEEHGRQCGVEVCCDICKKTMKAGQRDNHLETCASQVPCTTCGEPQSRGGMEKHILENHTKRPCELCSALIPVNRLQEHVKVCHTCVHCNTIISGCDLQQHMENICTALTRKCKYCELMFNNHQYASHVEACGSRTEACEACSKRIRIKDTEQHKLECVPRSASDKSAERLHLVPCDLCSAKVPDSRLQEHIRLCHTCEYCNTIIPSYDLKEHIENFCPAAMRKCNYCPMMLGNEEYPSHLQACGLRTEFCEGCSKLVALKDMEQHAYECAHTRTKKRRPKKCVCM